MLTQVADSAGVCLALKAMYFGGRHHGEMGKLWVTKSWSFSGCWGNWGRLTFKDPSNKDDSSKEGAVGTLVWPSSMVSHWEQGLFVRRSLPSCRKCK